MKWNKRFWILMGAIFGLLLITGVLAACNKPAKTDLTGWDLVWSDEFNGATLDTTKWNAINSPSVINNELEYYSKDDVYVENGNLVLRSQKRALGDRQYTSGEVDSNGKFALTYGKIEVRGKLPVGKGLWPAYWLVATSGAWPPEIDILEMLGDQPDHVSHGYIYIDPDCDCQMGLQEFHVGPDSSADFHTYGIEWDPGEIRFYFDGEKIDSINRAIYDQDMFLILNTAIGGAWPGSPDENTVFPQYHLIDYVRVYQRCDTCTPVPTATALPPTPTRPAPTPVPNDGIARIDSASLKDYTDSNGNVWSADTAFVDGNYGVRDKITIENSPDSPLFQTERWGLTGYSIPVENGTYTVKLYFSETYPRVTGPRQRVFNLDMEGQKYEALDVFAEAGGRDKPLIKTFEHVLVTDGSLDIKWERIIEATIIDAIEVLPGETVAPMPSPTGPIPTPTITPTPKPSLNLALNKPALASSGQIEASGFGPGSATDGVYTTRWSSAYSDPQWFYVDLGQVYDIDRLAIYWEVAYGKKYDIQVSNDAQTWTTVKSVSNGDGGLDDLSGLNARGRYVQVYCYTRGTQWGDSIWEFEVYAPVTVAQLTPVPVGPSGFVMGVNMNGGPVTIDGEQWLGYDQALTMEALVMRNPIRLGQTDIAWEPAANGDLKAMLNTQVWNWSISDINMMLPLANGDYQLYFWVAEDLYTDRSRLFKLSLQGTEVTTSVEGVWLGLQPLHNWTKYGPYDVTVDHEQLLIALIHLPGGHEPTISGLAVYKK